MDTSTAIFLLILSIAMVTFALALVIWGVSREWRTRVLTDAIKGACTIIGIASLVIFGIVGIVSTVKTIFHLN